MTSGLNNWYFCEPQKVQNLKRLAAKVHCKELQHGLVCKSYIVINAERTAKVEQIQVW